MVYASTVFLSTQIPTCIQRTVFPLQTGFVFTSSFVYQIIFKVPYLLLLEFITENTSLTWTASHTLSFTKEAKCRRGKYAIFNPSLSPFVNSFKCIFLPYLDGKRITPITKESTGKWRWEKNHKTVIVLKINAIKL